MLLVTGANGQLGFEVIKELEKRNVDCTGIDKNDLDITDKESVDNYILKLKPKCIIHCAAYTAVDKAEDEVEYCYKVNVNGTKNIAGACKNIDAKMIYISTDYIFDGQGNKPFEINNSINPISVYGRTKYEGELKVKEYLEKYFIVRTSWLFGINGNNFIKTMIRLGKERESIDVVCDQIGSPTYSVELAKILCDMAESEKYGVYHGTNEGFCSWAEFAEEIMKKAHLNCKINYITTSEYKAKAIRPLNSKLSKQSLYNNGFKTLPNWKDSLEEFLNEYRNLRNDNEKP